MMLNEKLYIDTVLPFGLCSTPKNFNSVADALQRIVKQCGISYLEHFLDDLITAVGPHCNECKHKSLIAGKRLLSPWSTPEI